MVNRGNLITYILATVLLCLSLFAFLQYPKGNVPVVSSTPEPSSINLPEGIVVPNPLVSSSAKPTATAQSNTTEVMIFLVALEDNGKVGEKVGCGDSVVGVKQTVDTTSPLKSAFEKLLAIKTQYYGQSGLYNSLYQSNLTVDSAVITNQKATIKLSGQVQLGGECDDPRFIEQLKQTALQFSSVKEVEIFINNKPIDQVINLKENS
jgi:hypothetical protein